MKTPRPLALLLVLLCAIVLTGCGEGTKTGSGVNLKPTGGGTGNLFPSTAAPTKKATTAPKPRATTAAPKPRATTARPQQTQVTAPPFTITIYGDKEANNKIDPPQAAVYSGTKVVWKNVDKQARGVAATNGAFASGPIPPGGTYTWVAGAPATYAYRDSTRPYVNASITVAPR